MKKGGFIVGDYLVWWIIAIAILVLSGIMYHILTDDSNTAIQALKNFFRLGK